MSNMKSSRNIISIDFEHQNYILENEKKGKLIFAETRKYCKNKAHMYWLRYVGFLSSFKLYLFFCFEPFIVATSFKSSLNSQIYADSEENMQSKVFKLHSAVSTVDLNIIGAFWGKTGD